MTGNDILVKLSNAGISKNEKWLVREVNLEIHKGKLKPQISDSFENLLLIGIGGSILGTQLLNNALVSKNNRMQMFFLDNTDPDGIDQIMNEIGQK